MKLADGADVDQVLRREDVRRVTKLKIDGGDELAAMTLLDDRPGLCEIFAQRLLYEYGRAGGDLIEYLRDRAGGGGGVVDRLAPPLSELPGPNERAAGGSCGQRGRPS